MKTGGFNEAGAGCSGIRGSGDGEGEEGEASMRPELGAPEYHAALDNADDHGKLQ